MEIEIYKRQWLITVPMCDEVIFNESTMQPFRPRPNLCQLIYSGMWMVVGEHIC